MRSASPARRVLVLALCAALALPAATVFAQERSEDEIAQDLERARQRERATRESLDQLLARAGSARQALAILQGKLERAREELQVAEGQVALAQGVLDEAEQAVLAAEEEVRQAEQQLRRTERELEAEFLVLQDQIISTYKYGASGPGIMALRVVQNAGTAEDVFRGMYSLGSVVDFQDRVVKRIAELQQRHARELDVTEQARQAAEDMRAEAAAALAAVEQRRAEAKAIADGIAADESNQRQLLAQLQAQSVDTQALLAGIAADARKLETELAASQARNGMLCPVRPSWFMNDWGYPRSGGRTHQGTDVFADIGTPIKAMRSGTIKSLDRTDRYVKGSSRGDLGGITISYWTGPGEYWYWAHLDSIHPSMYVGKPISQGEVIGYVGKTGNAWNTPPHVHVGHYVGGRAVNPYPVLHAACR